MISNSLIENLLISLPGISLLSELSTILQLNLYKGFLPMIWTFMFVGLIVVSAATVIASENSIKC